MDQKLLSNPLSTWSLTHLLRKLKWWIAAVVVIAAIIGIVVGVRNAREESRNHTCQRHLRQIGIALLTYCDIHGTLPPAYTCDSSHRPNNSWRILIYSSFQYNFPESGYKFEEAWNSAHNAKFFRDDYCKPVYQCPSANHHRGQQPTDYTDYIVVVGPNTFWQGCDSIHRTDKAEDREKILVIEIVNSNIRWMEPRDLTIDEAVSLIQPKSGVGIGSYHPRGINYLTVGNEIRTLDRDIDRNTLRELLKRSI